MPVISRGKAIVRSKRRISLLGKDVRVSQNLGNGFRRVVFRNRTIGPNEILTILLPAARGRRVISAGWLITQRQPAWATDNYPSTPSTWILSIQNPTSRSRTITPYLITKLR